MLEKLNKKKQLIVMFYVFNKRFEHLFFSS
jgi:hypothetical protein